MSDVKKVLEYAKNNPDEYFSPRAKERIEQLELKLRFAKAYLNDTYSYCLWVYEDEYISEMMDEEDRVDMRKLLDNVCDFLNKKQE